MEGDSSGFVDKKDRNFNHANWSSDNYNRAVASIGVTLFIMVDNYGQTVAGTELNTACEVGFEHLPEMLLSKTRRIETTIRRLI
jgi:hypothetical protein